MAYDPTNPPSLIGQGIGGVEGMRFFTFVWIDPIGDVLAPGYISNAEDIGMRPGDSLVYKDAAGVGEWLENHLVCMEVDANGAATVAFPDIPLEALPEADTFDPDDMTQYLVIYQGGRQQRIQIGLFAPNQASIASQAEAEAGTDNEKRMTALRSFQSIAAFITGRTTVEAPQDADGFLITDDDAADVPKRVTWLSMLGDLWERIGGFISGSPTKATPVDADALLLVDSTDDDAAKKLTIADLRTSVFGDFPTAESYLRRNAAGTGNESRTPAQVIGDIAALSYGASQALTPAQRRQARLNAGAEIETIYNTDLAGKTEAVWADLDLFDNIEFDIEFYGGGLPAMQVSLNAAGAPWYTGGSAYSLGDHYANGGSNAWTQTEGGGAAWLLSPAVNGGLGLRIRGALTNLSRPVPSSIRADVGYISGGVAGKAELSGLAEGSASIAIHRAARFYVQTGTITAGRAILTGIRKP